MAEKTPLLTRDETPIELWYEGPTWLVAEKPSGMAMHPSTPEGRGTLANALFQLNRWLADMETSVSPGIIHRLRDADQGLVVVAKNEEQAETLREAYTKKSMVFRYRVSAPAEAKPVWPEGVTTYDQHRYGERTVYDLETPVGDTAELVQTMWPTEDPEAIRFVCYQVEVPEEPHRHRLVASGHRIRLPQLELYTAPT